jgi:hypothetical protein
VATKCVIFAATLGEFAARTTNIPLTGNSRTAFIARIGSLLAEHMLVAASTTSGEGALRFFEVFIAVDFPAHDGSPSYVYVWSVARPG